VDVRDAEAGIARSVMAKEVLLVLRRDHEKGLGGTRPFGVTERVIAQEFPARAERFELLWSAEAGSASRRENQERPTVRGHGFAAGTTSQVK
jgi:hypothetical protein